MNQNPYYIVEEDPEKRFLEHDKVLDSKSASFYISGVTWCWTLKYILKKNQSQSLHPITCQPVNSCKQDRLDNDF